MNFLYRSENVIIDEDQSLCERNMRLGPSFAFRQGSMNPDHPEWLTLQYSKNCFVPSCYLKVIEKALILGLGTGAVGKAIKAMNELAQVDYVDCNPEVIHLASKYFHIDPEKYNIYQGDAVDYIINTKQKYDYILLDIWDDQGVPDFLGKIEFWKNLIKIINPVGVVVVNSPKKSEEIICNAMQPVLGDLFSLPGNNSTIINFRSQVVFERDFNDKPYTEVIGFNPFPKDYNITRVLK